ncbi:hypothetical protein DSO57_1035731 [Entomophthora muscae]|uniref:Uncharacterized protein n=1 Tax=Entomophthora muscae TaxID=34485 RepID=A0ACC2TXZ1_9FUNG|nr:hypothetical protein DSO57_1035731 [Entomophthora muscae]
MINIPDFVEYCALTCHGENDGLAIGHLTKVPSISIDSHSSQDSLKLKKFSFLATKLSLRTQDETFPTFFQWVIDCFPNLEHFVYDDAFPDDLLLPANCFPNLVHLHLAAEQDDDFWPKLIGAAPKLQYIYTDQLLVCAKLELINPTLQVKPFENILGLKGVFNEYSGFGSYL